MYQMILSKVSEKFSQIFRGNVLNSKWHTFNVTCCRNYDVFFSSSFRLKYRWYTILYKLQMYNSDSQFLKVIFHLYLKILGIFLMSYNKYILVAYFIHSSLYLQIPSPTLSLPLSLYPLVTTSVVSILVSLFLLLL